MRLHSTPESVKAKEATVLNIVETMIAVALTIYFAIKSNTLLYIAIFLLTYLFTLLRTGIRLRRDTIRSQPLSAMI